MKRIAIVAAAAALAACGGSSNSASSKSFTYGTPTTATPTQSTAVSSQLSTIIGARNSASASSAQTAVQFQSVTEALFGGSLLPSSSALTATTGQALSVARQGLSNGFDNPACVTETATRVTFTGCVSTNTSSSGSDKATVDGFFALAGDTASWDATIGVAINETGLTLNGSLKYAGNVTVTSTSVNGEMAADIKASATENGQSDSAEVSESVSIKNVTYDSSKCATGGTVEAKRVWVTRPSRAHDLNTSDKGALVTFGPACGTATIAYNK